MSLIQTFHIKSSLLLGSLLGLGFGCVIDLEPIEPCDSGSNNKLNDDGECVCRIGYDWCNPEDPEDLNCCDTGSADEIGDGDGDTGDGDGDGDGDTGDGDGDTTETGDGDGDGDTELPPETCTAEEEGFYWCTHSEANGPEGSTFYICQGGVWVENNGFMDESCVFDGYDFAYGCVDDGSSVVFECGDGSGEACDENSPAACVDDDQISYCLYGKETWDSCLAFCMEEGIEGTTYEYGECDDSVPEDVACFCCDSGDPGCPI